MIARVRALTKQTSRLDALAKGLVFNIQEAMTQHLEDTVERMRFEPAEKAGSRYKRTHNYKWGWRANPVTFTQSGLRGTISNDVPYAQDVGGDEAGNNQDPYGVLAPGWPLLGEEIRTGYQQRLKRAVRNI